MRRRATRIIAIFLGSGFIAAGWIAWSFQQPSVQARPFDQSEWLRSANMATDVGDPGCGRGALALGLIESKRLSGLTKSEVSAVLGEPTRYGPNWSYALGQCSGFGWHHSGLRVQFDGVGKVVGAQFQHAP